MHALGMGAPQATEVADGQLGAHTHAPPAHTCPAGHSVPVPQDGPPAHTFAMGAPQVTVAGSSVGQRGMHVHTPEALHRWPAGHRVPAGHAGPPGHTSATVAPQATPEAAGQAGMHSHAPIALQR